MWSLIPHAGVSGAQRRFIVTFSGHSPRAVAAAAPGFIEWILPNTATFEAADPQVLRAIPGAINVEPDGVVHALALPNDPCVVSCFGVSQWHLTDTAVPIAWDTSKGLGVTIGVLDTGIQPDHPDLEDKIIAPEVDLTGLDDGPGAHGTAVGGLAGATTDNSLWVAGVGWLSNLRSYKVLPRASFGSVADLVKGIRRAADDGVDVMNMSLGTTTPSMSLSDAVTYGLSRGVVMVAAAGNSTSTVVDYPAALPGVIAVAAHTATHTVSSYSNRGPRIDVAAPGDGLVTTGLDSTILTGFTGTSAAAPVVSGVVALMLSPGMRPPTSIGPILRATSLPLADDSGLRRVDAGAAVDLRPYGGFAGGVHLALGTLGSSSTASIVTGAGPGGGPHVRVFTDRHLPIGSFFAYDSGFRGGVDVAVGDVDGDGLGDIITGAGPGGGPHVIVRSFDAPTGAVTVTASFFAYDSGFRGGVSVAVGDVDGVPGDEIITGAGPGGGPHVRVFKFNPGTRRFDAVGGIMAYSSAFSGGVDVAAGDIDGDGKAEIITGAGPGGGPHVRILRYDISTKVWTEVKGFFAYPGFSGGVRVAVGDIDRDGTSEVITGAGPGGGPHAKAYDVTGTVVASAFSFRSSFAGGIDVAGSPDGAGASTLSASGWAGALGLD